VEFMEITGFMKCCGVIELILFAIGLVFFIRFFLMQSKAMKELCEISRKIYLKSERATNLLLYLRGMVGIEHEILKEKREKEKSSPMKKKS